LESDIVPQSLDFKLKNSHICVIGVSVESPNRKKTVSFRPDRMLGGF